MTAWLAAVALVAAIGIRRGWPVGRRRLAGSSIAGSGAAPAVAALAVGSGLAAAGVPVAVVVLALLAAGALVRLRRSRAQAADRNARAAAVVEATFALAAELRAGRSPAEALSAVASVEGPMAAPLRSAANAAVSGADAADELRAAAELPGAERLRYVASAWQVASSAGGRVAVVLERLGEGMDSDDELRRELEAALAGPRATMLVLAVLPVFGLAMGQAMGARPLQLLLHRPLGWGLLGAAAVLDAGGVALIRLITRRTMRC